MNTEKSTIVEDNAPFQSTNQSGNPKGSPPVITNKASVRKIAVWAAVVLVSLGCTLGIYQLLTRGNATAQTRDKANGKAISVNVATARMDVVPIEIRSIGNVLPYSVVNITPQVSGQLIGVHFTQGQMVT